MPSSAVCNDFIKRIAPLICRESQKRGYRVCSAIIAQACLESAYGTSTLAKQYFNFFGMKAGTKWKGAAVNLNTREEYSPGTLTNIKDYFRVYPDIISGVEGYFEFINTTRYANLLEAKTPQEYAELLKKDGYATSSTYVSTIMSVVSRYDLTKYDNPDNMVLYPAYTGTSKSIVDALAACGEKDTSKVHRSRIAFANGVVSEIGYYTGTVEQNSLMLSLLRQGKLIRV